MTNGLMNMKRIEEQTKNIMFTRTESIFAILPMIDWNVPAKVATSSTSKRDAGASALIEAYGGISNGIRKRKSKSGKQIKSGQVNDEKTNQWRWPGIWQEKGKSEVAYQGLAECSQEIRIKSSST